MNSISLTTESSKLQFKKRATEMYEYFIKRGIGIDSDFKENELRKINDLRNMIDFSLAQPKLNIDINVDEATFKLIVYGEY